MKNKQIIGIVVAGIVFVGVSASSIFTNAMAQRFVGNTQNTAAYQMSSLFGVTEPVVELPRENFVGIVRIEGTIQDTGSSISSSQSYYHQQTLDYVDKMMESDYNRGIMLYVDSPGGTVYASDEMYLKLMEYKEKTGRPIWAYMASTACSGAYYISMAADQIEANRNCWTGSIGVIISYYNYNALLDKLGIDQINITSGNNKAMGSGAIEMTEEQQEIMQGLVDEAYDQFVEIVADGRDMEDTQVREIADGRLYSAKQAQDLGLIDGISDYETYKLKVRQEAGGGSVFYEPSFETGSLFSSLFSAFRGIKEKSDAQLLNEFLEKEGNGVPLYYAKTGK